ncbi:caspase domain-containing protein [Thermodesulfobacteriota bacterium]
MKRIFIFFVFTLLVIILFPSFAFPERGIVVTEKRIALVIGNGDYRASHLANPVNDANDIAVALERCNFTVMKKTNATRSEMRKAIRDFGNKIKGGGVGLFYFAGHGIQMNGQNYLVPIEADVAMEDEVPDECLMVSSVLRKMETAGNRLNIVILDACRNTPFGRSFRSGNRGLARCDAL